MRTSLCTNLCYPVEIKDIIIIIIIEPKRRRLSLFRHEITKGRNSTNQLHDFGNFISEENDMTKKKPKE